MQHCQQHVFWQGSCGYAENALTGLQTSVLFPHSCNGTADSGCTGVSRIISAVLGP